MRISNYPTDTLTGTEMILATNVDAAGLYDTVNFTANALKTFILGPDGGGNSVVFEGTQPDQYETILTTIEPTTDNTINLPNISGTIGVFANNSYTLGTELITSTPAELNILDGVTATTAELNLLDGVTSTTVELNLLDGITSTTAELNILDGVTSTAAELNLLDGSSVGTAVNSKGVIYDAAGQIIANGVDVTGKISQIDYEVAHQMTSIAPTNTYFSTEINHQTFGGVLIRGISDSADGLGIRLYGTIGNENPTDTIAAVEIRGSKRASISTNHAALAATETVFKLGNLDADLITVLGSGNTTFAGTIIGDLIGDVTGDLTGNQSGGSISATTGTFTGDVTLSATAPKLIIKMPEVDHGMTALGTTDTLFSIERKHGTQGGALIRAMSDDAAGIPLQVYGTIGHHDPTDTVAAIELRGSRKNGSGGNSHAALADGETVLKVGNLGNDLITVKGNGDTTIAGYVKATTYFAGTSEDLADNGAASLTKTLSYFTTAAGETATLLAGTEGQIKMFSFVTTDAGSMVITVTNAGWKASGTGTITFDDIGDGCTLMYANSKWCVVGNNGGAFA